MTALVPILLCAAGLLVWGRASARRRVAALGGGLPGDEATAHLLRRVRRRIRGGGGSGARERADLERWPGLIQQMAALLRAGTEPGPLWAALHEQARRETPPEVGPVRRDLAALIAAGHRGAGIGAETARSLRAAPLVHPRSREVRDALAAAWETAGRTGAPLAQVLEGLAGAVEDELDALAARDTALAGPKATARILSSLPLLGLGLGLLMGTDPLGVLLGQAWGHLALAAGLLLSAAGLLWTRRLVRRAEEAAP